MDNGFDSYRRFLNGDNSAAVSLQNVAVYHWQKYGHRSFAAKQESGAAIGGLPAAVETTVVGAVSRSAHLYGPNQEEDTIYWLNVREAVFRWSISGDFAFELDKDPAIPLKSIRDVITIKIGYTNGTAETLIFDITVNEEGDIFVTQRGVPNTAA